MKIKFKKTKENAKMPTQATEGSAGFDLYASDIIPFNYHDKIKYGTGIAVEIPTGYVGLVFPRSSVAKKDMFLSNCVGVIDSDYRGEITLVFTVGFEPDNWYDVGDRIGQIVFVPTPDVELVESESLSETERGAGGYGSTGR